MAQKGLVVITGASSGIGKAIAQHFSREGYPLLLVARRLEKLQELNLPNTICEKLDITDTDRFKSILDKAQKQYGPVDCFINNAGVMLLGQIDTQAENEWTKMFDLNVLALLRNMQLVLSDMKKRKTGTIINISSIAGKKTFPNHAAYCGTKFAVSAISENVREEVADHGVRVISICPGAVETELLSHTTSSEIKKIYEGFKEEMGGLIIPDDIARAVIFSYMQPQNVCIRELVIAPTRQQP